MNQKQINEMVRVAKGKLTEAEQILDAMTADVPSEQNDGPETKPFIPPTPQPQRKVRVFHTFKGEGTINENGVTIPECLYGNWDRMLELEAVQDDIAKLPSHVPIMFNWCENGVRLPLDGKQLRDHRDRFYGCIRVHQRWRAGYYNLASTTLKDELPDCGVGFIRATYNSSGNRDPYKIAAQCNYLDRKMQAAVVNGWEEIIPSFNPFIHKGRKDGILAPMDLQVEAMTHLLIMWPRIDTIIWWGGSDTAEHAGYLTEVVRQAFDKAGVEVA
jgi:hypothetical protein